MATVLLIEDDSSVREMVRQVLSEAHDCHTADRAEQALEYLDLQNYDVAITDITMPGLGGVEILKRIRHRHPATPVIVISGRADLYKESLSGLGAFACFQKPFQLEELEDAVIRAIAHRQQLTE